MKRVGGVEDEYARKLEANMMAHSDRSLCRMPKISIKAYA